MKRLVYPPDHGTNRPRHPSKRRCRTCHAPATHVEVGQRPAAVLHRDGALERFTEQTVVFWCAEHGGGT